MANGNQNLSTKFNERQNVSPNQSQYLQQIHQINMSNFYSSKAAQQQQQGTNYGGGFSDQLKIQLPDIIQQSTNQPKVSHLKGEVS